MRRYRLILEVYDDDQLIRKMEESRDQLDSDYDGEQTIGFLMSFVPSWSAAEGTGGDGLPTLAYMCHFLPIATSEDMRKFKEVGDAYDVWRAAHTFASCVDVQVNHDRLACDAVKCERHPDPA